MRPPVRQRRRLNGGPDSSSSKHKRCQNNAGSQANGFKVLHQIKQGPDGPHEKPSRQTALVHERRKKSGQTVIGLGHPSPDGVTPKHLVSKWWRRLTGSSKIGDPYADLGDRAAEFALRGGVNLASRRVGVPQISHRAIKRDQSEQSEKSEKSFYQLSGHFFHAFL